LLELAELLACPVVDLGGRFNFPGGHPLDLTACREEALREADLVLALDVYDLASALSSSMLRERTGAHLAVPTDAKIAHITLGDFLYSSWVTDVQKLLPVDLPIAGDSALALPELVRLCQIEMRAGPVSLDRIEERRQRVQELHENASARFREATQQAWPARPMSALRVYGELWELIREEDWALVNGQYGAIRQSWDFREPAQFAGSPRGAGLGYALGASLGGALAHKGSGRICIDIQGDGDFLYTPSALWTAVNCQIPLLIVLLNNRSYGNDERHQEHMAITRGRPVENKGVGIHLTSPETDFATLARSFQVAGFGPIEDPEALRPVLAEAIKVVKSGRPALVDVVTRLG
ncbi:MAG TPA: thiamine pyrophosphate-dependent enzyme, partial [Dehalococcoidia bacterium]|nr:thiamine pyrophosphate-dependent enzyme [Dehalococcoidia bacterium]